MRRRYRRKSFRGRRRRFRRRSVARKAYRVARSLSRKMAGEVRKADRNAIVTETAFTQLTPALGSSADNATSLPDYGYLYNLLPPGASQQGLQMADFSGNQIRVKTIYIGIHVQMPVRPDAVSAQTIQQPLCIRCMIVQDKNFAQALTLTQMVTALFGITVAPENGFAYSSPADYTLLPINPRQPGRFNVIRDFKMTVAPGYRQDYYKKIMLLQRDLFSGGRVYAAGANVTNADAPTDVDSSWESLRNGLYILLLYQSPTIFTANPPEPTQSGTPDFTISLQSRLSFYDN